MRFFTELDHESAHGGSVSLRCRDVGLLCILSSISLFSWTAYFMHWISALDFFDPVHSLIPLACIARTCTCTLIHSSVLDGRGSPAECGYMTSCLKGNHGARK